MKINILTTISISLPPLRDANYNLMLGSESKNIRHPVVKNGNVSSYLSVNLTLFCPLIFISSFFFCAALLWAKGSFKIVENPSKIEQHNSLFCPFGKRDFYFFNAF